MSDSPIDETEKTVFVVSTWHGYKLSIVVGVYETEEEAEAAIEQCNGAEDDYIIEPFVLGANI